jgi:flagellar hook protein FlgE
MMRGMFAAISGLKTHQTMLDVTANDIANVNTIGYKASRTTFADALSQLQRGGTAPSAGSGGSNAAQIGLGVNVGSIDNMMGSGAFQSTGSVLDVAIQGKGFFRVGPSPTPPPGVTVPTQVQYTRAGNLAVNTNGYLTTQDGNYVVGRTVAGGGVDTLLSFPAGSTDVAIGEDGAVTYTLAGARATAGFISLATFPNEQGLERVSGTRWRESAASGTPTPTTPNFGGTGRTIAGVLEMSNVDLASEFTEMISAQRGFQANSRVISASDQMLQDLVQLGR